MSNKFLLSKPHEFEGQEYTELDLNLEMLTGADLMKMENEARVMGDKIPVIEFSKTFLILVASKAAKQPYEFFEKLPINDFSKITIQVQNFLLE